MANFLKEVRKRTGLTQTQLAEAAGTSLRQIAYLEKTDGDRKDRRDLDVEWIDRIVSAFHNLGSKDIEPWMLVADAKPADSKDIEFLSRYHSLPPEKKKKVDEIIFGKGPHIKKKPAK